MSSLKGTKTEQNLLKAFAGESQATNRYNFFAKQASKEGFKQISNLFLETARNEEVHAKAFFKYLEGGDVEITATYPAGKIGTTLENLKAAAMGENEEHTELYPEFAETAKAEGFKEIAATFKFIAKVEEEHEKRFLKLADNIEKNIVFEKDESIRWKCDKCGYVHEGNTAPNIFPSCKHKQEYFEVKETNY
jgi:rubrerythrin